MSDLISRDAVLRILESHRGITGRGSTRDIFDITLKEIKKGIKDLPAQPCRTEGEIRKALVFCEKQRGLWTCERWTPLRGKQMILWMLCKPEGFWSKLFAPQESEKQEGGTGGK